MIPLGADASAQATPHANRDPPKPTPAATAGGDQETSPWGGFGSIVLLLQGGGALGAYQAGVYEAAQEHGIDPTWVAGISIGAINCAIIAGNPVQDRVGRLRDFWERVSRAAPGLGGLWSDGDPGRWDRGAANRMAADRALLMGVPGFFTPRIPPPALQPKGGLAATSWYDTRALRGTLERLVDFERINAGETRLSVGAVNVRTADFTHFDTTRTRIGVEHIMASAALPPAFPAVDIDGDFYWDGGLVSNTPLSWIQSEPTQLDTLILQVDLWCADGAMPGDLAQVASRMKEIQYSSRTRTITESFRKTQDLRLAFGELLPHLPPEVMSLPQAKTLAEASQPAVCKIVELVYRSPAYEDQAKDYEFSRRSMDDHWRAGYRDAKARLAQSD